MIRLATKDDQDVVIAIAKNVRLFEPEELVFLEEMFNKWLEGDLGENSKWIVASKGGVVIGTAYFAPEQFANGTWNVYFIAVEPDKQRSGIGADLMDYIEKVLATQGERVLIVETSSLPRLEKARKFYLRQGYYQESCIREFYKAGDDKITFRKSLT